jgi:hypothetical protein
VIDGMRYESDLLLYPDGGVDACWWRNQGHVLAMADIRPILNGDPELVIAGTGVHGMMRPERDLEKQLKSAGIEFVAQPTQRAVRLFNEMSLDRRVAACLHLTC